MAAKRTRTVQSSEISLEMSCDGEIAARACAAQVLCPRSEGPGARARPGLVMGSGNETRSRPQIRSLR